MILRMSDEDRADMLKRMELDLPPTRPHRKKNALADSEDFKARLEKTVMARVYAPVDKP
ncbi:hypothetical protein LCGC14_0354770 [marine sediment metagenome]|uniref:Uncharacterized protein n=1 Tax=marine sediment metagenome TaxID=412755 RepID=A0A0F9TSH9_9ZZZZ